MGSRFGRNKKRKLEEEYERRLQIKDDALLRTRIENGRLSERLSRSIEIDCSVLRRPDRATYEVRMAAYRDGSPSLWQAMEIEERQVAMARDGFVEHASRIMAMKIAEAIGDKTP